MSESTENAYYIGNYRIDSPIGEGGMGVVYRAEHKLLGRPAAVKVLLPEYSNNQEVVDRFFNEAKASAAAKNPGIVEIYDFGYERDGSAYIAMEYLEGEDLEQRLKRVGFLGVPQTLLLTQQIAGALAAAHHSGVIHRDLKPANIFLVADPQVIGGERIKLLDFGIAKVSLANQSTESGKTGKSHQTRAHAVMGTPSYMAPEQCRGAADVDARADLYSVGCIVFEMLCGRAPFSGESAVEIMSAHLRESPPMPSELQPTIGPQLESMILALLAKNPAERFQRAVDLERAVNMLLSGDGSGVITPDVWRERDEAAGGSRRRFLTIAAVMMMTMAAVGAYFGVAQSTGPTAEVIAENPDEITPQEPVIEETVPVKPPAEATFFAARADGAMPEEVSAAEADDALVVRKIISRPAGARISYRGEPVGIAEPMLWAVIPSEKSHTITAELYDHVPLEYVLTGDASGDDQINMIANVKVTIRSQPKGAVIYDADGVGQGRTPAVVGAPPNPHSDEVVRLTLKLDGYADEVVEFIADEDKEIRVKLTELVRLTIESEPPGAEVWRDGEQLGLTPVVDMVPKSRQVREYEVRMSGYETALVAMKPRKSRDKKVVLVTQKQE